MKARENPFRSERLAALPFRFVDGGWDELWARFERCGRRAALVGPAGSGKTTLLRELARRLPGRGLAARLVAAPRPGEPDASFWQALARLGPDEAVLLDGGERVGFWAWRRLARATAAAGAVIVTQHREHRLPTLLRTRTTPALLAELVDELAGGHGALSDLGSLFATAGGDLHRAFLELYDRAAPVGQRPRPVPHSQVWGSNGA